mgnify:FL=1
MSNELKKIGVNFYDDNGVWTLDKRNNEFSNEASIETYKDHRMAMAFAPLASEINITINNPDVVNKSYPSFWEDMKKAGYDII